MPHRLARAACVDLDEIWTYLVSETGDETLADRQIDELVERFHLLSEYPELGRRRDEPRQGLRGSTVGNYIIFYRIERSTVAVLRVLHGRRNFPAIFG